MSRAITSRVGIDTGGTFTDFVHLEDGVIRIHKQFSTPGDPSRSVLDGIQKMNLGTNVDVVHGSTVATNALLERRGARTALVTTAGFADVIEIGRQDRPDLYALVPQRPETLVPAELRFEVDERVSADGSILRTLQGEQLGELKEKIRAANVEAIAVCLLFSFLNPEHEAMIAEVLSELAPVSLSSQILPEYREYERTSTTVLNAYVTPLMERYISRLQGGLEGRRLHVMQSNGGVITAETVGSQAARTALSGPAGGAVGAFYIGQQAGFDNIITFDMGGTSTDVALLPGRIVRTRESTIGGLPLRLPVVDVHTVGAGGGSIARVDAGGALRVGPESAGADPGPACYGSGAAPTTSDANLLLGRLQADRFLGGQVPLYPERAQQALAYLISPMHVASVQEAAWGVIQVANATMVRAIRKVSVERGYDPRTFTLVAYGGAGPLHACDLAEALRIPRVLIPKTPGVLSALGMAVADITRDYSQSMLITIQPDEHVAGRKEFVTIFDRLTQLAQSELAAEGVEGSQTILTPALDMRYVGQSHEITINQPDGIGWLEAFHNEHERLYGHQHPESAVEVVNVRLFAVGLVDKPEIAIQTDKVSAAAEPIDVGDVWFNAEQPAQTAFYKRDDLQYGHQIAGPAVVFQLDTTTVIPPGWYAEVDGWGNLLLET